jgi:uncharacterized protein (DUF924 family)
MNEGNPMNDIAILDFWFDEIDSSYWWKKDLEFDRQIAERFGKIHEQARSGELFRWRDSPHGRLSEIIILDQFSRNMFRGQPQSFAYDPLALILAQEAVRVGADLKVKAERRAFFYMPYMHSESRVVQEESLRVFDQKGLEGTKKFAEKHKVIIDRFGRYPHRNQILDRPSTDEEITFLEGPGSLF